jgi:hypothetical protein
VEGRGVKMSHDTEMKWRILAAQKGCTDAMIKLYWEYKPLESNNDWTSLDWLTLASKQGKHHPRSDPHHPF